ncbi:hypothetical protein CSV26_18485, partial [Clostridioides difficile]|nr:hypothetical protein [Clostridioides difficile]
MQSLIYYSSLLHYRLLLLQHFCYIAKSYLLQFFIILQTFIITISYLLQFFAILQTFIIIT